MFILRRIEARGEGEGGRQRWGKRKAELARLVTRILTFEGGRKQSTSNDKAEAEREVHIHSRQTVKR